VTIPKPSERPLDQQGCFTLPWRQWLAQVDRRISANGTNAADVAADVSAIATALGSPDGTVANIPDQDDENTFVIVSPDGTIAVTGTPASGSVMLALRQLEDSGTGAALYKFTRDAYGRVSGTHSATTDDLAEGSTNKYYTDERAQDAVAAAFANGTQSGCTVSYSDASNALSIAVTGGSAETPPLAANFSTFGSTVTVSDKIGRMQLVVSSASGQLRGITQNSIATPYTIDAHIHHTGAPAAGDESGAGLCLSDGTKYIQFTIGNTNGVLVSRIITWATSSSGATVLATISLTVNPGDFYVRITDDGTTRKYLLSANGKGYFQVFSHATNTFLTHSKFGIGIYNNAFGSLASKTAVDNWLVSSSVLGDAA
jgi:hypothetical protein